VERLAKIWIEAVLHRDDVDDLLRPLDLLDRHVRESDVLALPFALQRGKDLDALLESDRRIGRVQLIKPDLMGVQRAQASLACLANVLRRSVARPCAARPA